VHLPLNINVLGMTALVVGGGSIAERKILTLLEAGATVKVVSPEMTPKIALLAVAESIKLRSGCYEPHDLCDSFLVIAATNDPVINNLIADDARLRGILVDVVSGPENGNCTFPALLRRGNLEISVSTNGSCPGYSAIVRDRIAGMIGEEYGTILETLTAEREKLLTEDNHSTYNSKILRDRARELINKLTEHKERVP